MKHREFQIDIIDNEDKSRKIPNDGREEIDIEPLNWNDM